MIGCCRSKLSSEIVLSRWLVIIILWPLRLRSHSFGRFIFFSLRARTWDQNKNAQLYCIKSKNACSPCSLRETRRVLLVNKIRWISEGADSRNGWLPIEIYKTDVLLLQFERFFFYSFFSSHKSQAKNAVWWRWWSARLPINVKRDVNHLHEENTTTFTAIKITAIERY